MINTNKPGNSRTGERVRVYIDGFNLYFGLRSKNWKNLYWLDLAKLSHNLLKPDQVLDSVSYFTSIIASGTAGFDKVKRQNTWLEALQTLPSVEIILGHYLAKPVVCRKCGAHWTKYEEKMTDVNIATRLLEDAVYDRFDLAILISADSDLVPPVSMVAQKHMKRMGVIFPPDRKSDALAKVATFSFTLGRKKLKDSLFPDEVTKHDGFVLRKPSTWK